MSRRKPAKKPLPNRAMVRHWLHQAGVSGYENKPNGPRAALTPPWANMLHASGAWKLMSYREVRRVADDEGMQEAVEASWRMNGRDGVLSLVAQSLWQGSR